MKRVINYIPAIKGCYGFRVWVPNEDTELMSFFKLVCLWGNYTDRRETAHGYEVLYELPSDTEDTVMWRLACKRLGIEFVR